MSFMDGDQFPRPNTPDFWRLSDVTLRLDGAAVEGEATMESICQGVIDIEALFNLADQRSQWTIQRHGLDPGLRFAMTAMFTTAVLIGIEFEKAGGHRP